MFCPIIFSKIISSDVQSFQSETLMNRVFIHRDRKTIDTWRFGTPVEIGAESRDIVSPVIDKSNFIQVDPVGRGVVHSCPHNWKVPVPIWSGPLSY